MVYRLENIVQKVLIITSHVKTLKTTVCELLGLSLASSFSFSLSLIPSVCEEAGHESCTHTQRRLVASRLIYRSWHDLRPGRTYSRAMCIVHLNSVRNRINKIVQTALC